MQQHCLIGFQKEIYPAELSRSPHLITSILITSRGAERKTLQLAGEKFTSNDVCKSSLQNPDTFSLAEFGFWFIAKRQGSWITRTIISKVSVR